MEGTPPPPKKKKKKKIYPVAWVKKGRKSWLLECTEDVSRKETISEYYISSPKNLPTFVVI